MGAWIKPCISHKSSSTVHARQTVLEPCPYRFIELCLLLQIETNDAVVVIDPVTVEVIHLSCNQTQETNYLTEAFIMRNSFTQFKLVQTCQHSYCSHASKPVLHAAPKL